MPGLALEINSHVRQRWIECDDDREVITLLDNGRDPEIQFSQFSSAQVIELDKTTSQWIARLLHRYARPGDEMTRLRGNHQTLPNGNAFVNWGENGHVSEYSRDGTLLLDAIFQSPRFITYRAYKSDYIGRPHSPPDLAGVAYGTSRDTSLTMLYVSWNGATEVAEWRFYSVDESSESNDMTHLGSVPRSGFETEYYVQGYVARVLAEAVAEDGTVLGTTVIKLIPPPKAWDQDVTVDVPGAQSTDQHAKTEL